MYLTRRTYFIKKNFQTRFILRFVVTTTIWAVAAAFLFVFMAERRLEEVLYSPHINVRTTVDIITPSLLTAHLLSLALFGILLLFAVWGLWRRLSLPLFILKKDIQRLAGGDLASHITLGEHDEFQDLAADLDRMRSELRGKFVRLKERQTALSDAAAGLERAVLKDKETVVHADALKKAVERMKEELNGFTY